MAHRKTQADAEAVKASFEKNHPDAKIVIKNHPRGGFIIAEARNCEECNGEFTTIAVGEIEMSGNFCRKCKIEVYEQRRQARSAESSAHNADQDALWELMDRLNN